MSVEHNNSGCWEEQKQTNSHIEKEPLPTWISDHLRMSLDGNSPEKVREALLAERPSELLLRLSGRFAFYNYLLATKQQLDEVSKASENLQTVDDISNACDKIFDSLEGYQIALEKDLEAKYNAGDVTLAKNYLIKIADETILSTSRHYLQDYALWVFRRSTPDKLIKWAAEIPYDIVDQFTDFTSDCLTLDIENPSQEEIQAVLEKLRERINDDIDLALINRGKIPRGETSP